MLSSSRLLMSSPFIHRRKRQIALHFTFSTAWLYNCEERCERENVQHEIGSLGHQFFGMKMREGRRQLKYIEWCSSYAQEIQIFSRDSCWWWWWRVTARVTLVGLRIIINLHRHSVTLNFYESAKSGSISIIWRRLGYCGEGKRDQNRNKKKLILFWEIFKFVFRDMWRRRIASTREKWKCDEENHFHLFGENFESSEWELRRVREDFSCKVEVSQWFSNVESSCFADVGRSSHAPSAWML